MRLAQVSAPGALAWHHGPVCSHTYAAGTDRSRGRYRRGIARLGLWRRFDRFRSVVLCIKNGSIFCCCCYHMNRCQPSWSAHSNLTDKNSAIVAALTMRYHAIWAQIHLRRDGAVAST